MSRRHSHKGSATSSPPSSPKSPTIKFKDEILPDLWLGRPGTSLKIGIVGLPNIGKSLFFNAITNSTVPTENYPFTTKNPNEARARVPDERFDTLCEIYQPQIRTPAYLTVVDIAGLVKGASEGLGLGNQFLANISATDAIFHVVRAFDMESIVHIDDTIDPVRDLETVTAELIAKDLAYVLEQKVNLVKKSGRGGTKGSAQAELKIQIGVLDKAIEALENGQQIRFVEWHSMEVDFVNSLLLLTAKPQIFLINVSEKDYCRKKNKYLLKIKTWVDEHCPGELIIPFCAEMEMSIAESDASTNDKANDSECKSAMQKIIGAGYSALHLIRFYTKEGTKENKAWSVRLNTTALEAAGKVHSDFKAGFICCEVIHFDDLMEFQGDEHAVKEGGKVHQEGKGYIVQDGDILHFKAKVGSSKARTGRGKSH